MQVANRVFFLLFYLFPSLLFGAVLEDEAEIAIRKLSWMVTPKLSLRECLLPNNHPLNKRLDKIFNDPKMFQSPDHLHRAGFQVFKRMHRGLMVASHPSLNNYLFKKFQNKVSQQDQLNNYLSRINGARALSNFIAWNHLEHITVPQKWLYCLPKEFSDPKTKERSYILIVEKMDICSGEKDPNGELAQRYRHIEKDVLRELCMVVYCFRGLDSVLPNMPFTHQNKIAFIDTERWERKREGFLPHVMPYLSEESQAYALSVLQELCQQELQKTQVLPDF